MPKYDFAHPDFSKGYPTFKEKVPDLIDELANRLRVLRFEFIRRAWAFTRFGEIKIKYITIGENRYLLRFLNSGDQMYLERFEDINKIVTKVKNDMR